MRISRPNNYIEINTNRERINSMKKIQTKRLLVISLIVFVLIGITIGAICIMKNKKGEKSPDEVGMISAGFYLYNANREPIYQDDKIELKKDMDFYLDCVNACDRKLYFSFAVIVDNCFQKASFINVENGENHVATEPVKANESKLIHVKFNLENYEESTENGKIRFVLLYYTDVDSKDSDALVYVTTAEEEHETICKEKNVQKKPHNVMESKYFDINSETISQEPVITDKEEKEMPATKRYLDRKKGKKYINATGNENTYYGIIFVDGEPQLINDDYLFEWKQKKDKMSVLEWTQEFDSKKHIFMYMFEKDSETINSIVTTQYWLQ